MFVIRIHIITLIKKRLLSYIKVKDIWTPM